LSSRLDFKEPLRALRQYAFISKELCKTILLLNIFIDQNHWFFKAFTKLKLNFIARTRLPGKIF